MKKQWRHENQFKEKPEKGFYAAASDRFSSFPAFL